MLKTAGRESRNPTLDHYENLALNLSLTGLKKPKKSLKFAD
jgi:hypothetical protein